MEVPVVSRHLCCTKDWSQRLGAEGRIHHVHLGRSQLVVYRIHHQQMILLVAGAKWICAVAHVLCAAIPEIAEVKDCIDRAWCIAASYSASIDSLGRICLAGVRENRVDYRSC